MAIQQSTDFLTKYWKQVSPEPNSGCWIWLGAINQSGYGRIWLHRSRVRKVAHRVSYEDRYGDCIPEKMQLDHLCRVRCCVNPDHLEIVTQEENMRRSFRHGLINIGPHQCIHGHELADHGGIRKNGSTICQQCMRDCRRKYREKIRSNKSKILRSENGQIY